MGYGKMINSNEWREVELGEVIDVIHGYAFKGKNITLEENGNVLLTPGNVAPGGGFLGTKIKYYDGDIPEKYVLSPGDTFVNMTDLSKTGDTLGYPAKVPRIRGKIFLHNQRLGLIKIKSKDVDPEFLFWKLRDPAYRAQVLGSATGTTVRHTSPSRIKEIEIGLPKVREQREIASILSSIESKIGVNRRMNQNLEEIGKTLFKRWFVDFEFPNEEGKPYKSSGGEMVDSELGRVPKGWRVMELDKVAEFLNGIPCQKYPPVSKEESLPVIKIAEIHRGFSSSSNEASSKVDRKYIVNCGDILFSWSGSLEVISWPFESGVLNQHIFKVSSKNYPNWFVYYWLRMFLPEFKIIASSKATTMGHIQRKHLSKVKVLVPNDVLMNLMDSVLSSIFKRIKNNNLENSLLSRFKEYFLPMLLSGRLRIL